MVSPAADAASVIGGTAGDLKWQERSALRSCVGFGGRSISKALGHCQFCFKWASLRPVLQIDGGGGQEAGVKMEGKVREGVADLH